MIDKLNDIGLVTTIIQMFIGGVLLFIFRIWLIKEEDFRNRVKFLKEKKMEEICDLLQNIFNRERDGNIPLRGEKGQQQDLLIAHTRILLDTALFFHDLKKRQLIVTILNNYLIITIFIGGLFLIVLNFLNSFIFIFSIFSLLFIISQIIVFFILRRHSLYINKFEDL
jgi:hypothetical protein